MKIPFLLFAHCFISFFNEAAVTCPQDDLEQMLRSEGMERWHSMLSDIQKGSSITWKNVPDAIVHVSENGYAIHDVIGQQRMVTGTNGKYQFWLMGNSLQQMRIRNWRRNEIDPESSPDMTRMVSTSMRVYRNWPLNLDGLNGSLKMSLLDAVKAAEFKITSSKEASLDGHSCIEYSWRFIGNAEEFPSQGRFWVDPKSRWSVLGIDWQSDEGAGKPSQVRFSDFQPLRSSLVPQVYDYQSGQPNIDLGRFEVRFSEDYNPDTLFLSFYGLPEPLGVGNSNVWPLWVKIVLAGLVIVVGSAVLAKLSNKQS